MAPPGGTWIKEALLIGWSREKSPAPSGIQTHDLSVTRCVLHRCATTSAQTFNSFVLPPQAVELGIALLEGGHQEIQKSLFNLLQSGDLSQSFFHVFHEKMNDAQMEIKSTVTVNTTEIAARANEDNKDSKELEKNGNKKRARELTIFYLSIGIIRKIIFYSHISH